MTIAGTQFQKHSEPTARNESALVHRAVPNFQAKVKGSVQTLDWRNETEKAHACKLLEQHAAKSPDGPCAPVLIKGAAKDWPALSHWNLQYFQQQYAPQQRVLVRCAPSMQFFYVEPSLLPLWRQINKFLCRSSSLPPSALVPMSMQEFVARMQEDCSLPNAVYPEQGEEFYYLQCMLARGMLADVDLYSPPLSCLGRPGMAGADGKTQSLPSGLQIAQVPRVFASPGGAVSPLHFDAASSFLTQIRGRKRLVFYQPEDLKALYPYPPWHILRRRSRVNPADPDLRRFPKFRGLIGVEAILEPGDVLFFPGYWSHYTESIDFSISMTYRFWTEERKPRKGVGRLLRRLSMSS